MKFDISRRKMVETQLVGRGIRDPLVIEAMLKVPRHAFVQEAMAAQAYSDTSLPIGEKQTISQPYTVAFMTELLQLTGHEKVLEIGTGSGYQTAILASLSARVCTIERVRSLALRARKALDGLGLLNVNLKIGDGSEGWEEEAPFDGIIVTAGAPYVPQRLLAQLAEGGRLIIPVGTRTEQTLIRYTRDAQGEVREEKFSPCRFVRLIGRDGWGEES